MDSSGHEAKLDKTDAAASTSAEDQQSSEEVRQPGPAESTDFVHGAKAFLIYLLEVESEEFVNSSNHSEAIKILLRLERHQPHHIKTMLTLAKCYFYMDEYNDCFRVLKKIRGVLLKPPRPLTRDLLVRLEKCKETGERFTSLVLLWCCCWLSKTALPNDALETIKECLCKINDVNQDWLGKESERTMTRVASVSCIIIDDIRMLSEEIETNDSGTRNAVLLHCVGCKALCLRGIGSRCGAGEAFIDFTKRLKKLPVSTVSDALVYGGAVASSGFVHALDCDYLEAKSAFLDAQSIFEECKPECRLEECAKNAGLKCTKEELKKIRALERTLQLPGGCRWERSRSSIIGRLSKMLRIFRKGN